MQELEQLFASKDSEWQQNGVYDYIVEKLITDGARFNLVATPNVEASEAQVVALAESFGKTNHTLLMSTMNYTAMVVIVAVSGLAKMEMLLFALA